MSETTTATGTGDTGQQGDPTGTGQAPATTPAGTDPATGTGAEQDQAATIARLESELAAARKDAGRSRVTAKQQAADDARAQLAQEIGKAIGLVPGDTPPDPAQLTQQLTESQAQARQTAVELAVYRTARAAGADPDALLDSRAFAASLADVDPADTDAVTDAIKAAVQANPKLSAAPAGPPRGGADFTGQQGAGITPAQFEAMGYAARAELFQTDPDTYRRLAG
ncbi:scaffolding protein [Streptomyces phage Cumberbatch]|uniref:Scaffolding protein n=2 Tax=Ignaciovirus TaxID=3152509 RepID=A0A9E7E5H7_9CAUD|nr:scaffolding protein [Streptomyces phage Cumberbatch]YP_010756476.1 scaffolding protein [Streptomyces phage Piccadilly]YP_010756534.1 scaffolding protein [Streptomyces phage Eastland]QKN87649.1 scaffolding protein [Streptomyces phage Cumberbatch]UJQ86019.1 scaffolding protein [Streptomyces phage Piccadilly]URC17987.1 scaffolding protein [Streptomyces phage Eastland]